jgi:hypothetical protein
VARALLCYGTPYRNHPRRDDTNDHDARAAWQALLAIVRGTKPKNADKDSLEISLRMADWLALHPRRQTHDR